MMIDVDFNFGLDNGTYANCNNLFYQPAVCNGNKHLPTGIECACCRQMQVSNK